MRLRGTRRGGHRLSRRGGRRGLGPAVRLVVLSCGVRPAIAAPMPWKTSGDSVPVKVWSGWMLKSTSSSGVAPETWAMRVAYGRTRAATSGDRGVGDAEHGDVRLGDLVVATERAVDGES